MLPDISRGSGLLDRMSISHHRHNCRSGGEPDPYGNAPGFHNGGTRCSTANFRNYFTDTGSFTHIDDLSDTGGFTYTRSPAALAASASTQRITAGAVAAGSASSPARSYTATHTTGCSGSYPEPRLSRTTGDGQGSFPADSDDCRQESIRTLSLVARPARIDRRNETRIYARVLHHDVR